MQTENNRLLGVKIRRCRENSGHFRWEVLGLLLPTDAWRRVQLRQPNNGDVAGGVPWSLKRSPAEAGLKVISIGPKNGEAVRVKVLLLAFGLEGCLCRSAQTPK